MAKPLPKGYRQGTVDVFACSCTGCGLIYESAMPKGYPCPNCGSAEVEKHVKQTVETIRRDDGFEAISGRSVDPR